MSERAEECDRCVVGRRDEAKLKAQRLGRIEEATRATSPVPGVRSATEASAGCHQTRLLCLAALQAADFDSHPADGASGIVDVMSCIRHKILVCIPNFCSFIVVKKGQKSVTAIPCHPRHRMQQRT